MNKSTLGHNPAGLTPESIGHFTDKISVELSTRFLEHFSEQLYSSPQKAFEELISNGWDAGAITVDVRIPADLKSKKATMSVLDNGCSMDASGLKALWHIAFSPKKDKPEQFGRPVIGKFGIGKLATYVLARKLTYICKAADGKIRRVTMDYGEIDRQKGIEPDRLIRDLELDMFEVDFSDVAEALKNVYDGEAILKLIAADVPLPEEALSENEFGSQKSSLAPPPPGTWTLVLLSDLKPVGQELKIGILKRMLEAALPFGSEMAISVNGELLRSSKSDSARLAEWVIGPALAIDSIRLAKDARTDEQSEDEEEVIQVTSTSDPFPHINIPGIGVVTGRAVLFEERISGGKSEEHGTSNGFHVNVLGRVVNQSDPSFGEENLSHAAWARFRMTVRADGLNMFLTTDREKFRDSKELRVFRAFLRAVFNKSRTQYDSDSAASLPDGGDVLVKSLGVLSLNPLRNVVSETLKTRPPINGLLDDSGIQDREVKRQAWKTNTADNIRNALGQIKYEKIEDESFAKYRISDNTIVVNRDHPFVVEHSRTKAEKELLRTIAMVNVLSDVYALDLGVEPSTLDSIRRYRDQLMRFRAMQRRQSGTHIAKLLLNTQHDSSNSRRFETVVNDAIRYLGYQVKELGKSGEPEGLAKAYPTPTNSDPTPDDPTPPLYSFTYDAKSSKHDVASTNNINLAGVVEHRARYNANYALVVAPAYSEGALTTRCRQQKVTPISAHDLGRLLEYTVEFGAIPLNKLRDLFGHFDPNEVSDWVTNLDRWLRTKRPLTIATFLQALESLKGKIPDVLPAGTIALTCRTELGASTVKADDVLALAKGLAILVPDLVGVENDRVVVNASSSHVAAAITTQLENLRTNETER